MMFNKDHYSNHSKKPSSNSTNFVNERKLKLQDKCESDYEKYIVQQNDTVESVAAKFNMTPSDLCSINRLKIRILFVNQSILVKKVSDSELKCSKSENSFRAYASESSQLHGGDRHLDSSMDQDLLPLNFYSDYMKLSVRYITDNEGIISGSLIIAPLALCFIPALLDPVVMEWGYEQFTLHLPNSKIACISMYNDPSIMSFKRSQRKHMSNALVSPRQSIVKEAEPQSISDNDDFSSIGSLNKSMYKSIFKDSKTMSHNEPASSYNYLCVVASPRYKKVATDHQKKDEFWFTAPAANAQSILEYMLTNAKTRVDIGDDVDPGSHWPMEDRQSDGGDDDTYNNNNSSKTSSSNVVVVEAHRKLRKTSSFAQITDSLRNNDNTSNISHSNSNSNIQNRSTNSKKIAGNKTVDGNKKSFDEFLNQVTDWEIVNTDHLKCGDLADVIQEDDMTQTTILTPDQVTTLLNNIPCIAYGAFWELVYSTDRDGWSLNTLYRNVFNLTRNPCIIIIKDSMGNIFGVFCSHYIKRSPHFYGTGITFLFRWNGTKFEKFSYSKKNDYFILGNVDYFAVGCSNARNAIRIEENLFNGITQPCDTFNSPALVDSEDFVINCLEVWSFY